MNSQPCCGVNLSRPTIPLVTPVFWNTGALPYATTLNISRQDDDIHSCNFRYSCVWEFNITFWFAPIITVDLAFLKSLWILLSFRSLSYLFPYGNDETGTQNMLIFRQKSNRFCHTDVTFPSSILRILNSSHILCSRFCSTVLSGVSKPNEK